MTRSHSNNFELIRAYKKYSYSYRNCTDKQLKNFILTMWFQDVNNGSGNGNDNDNNNALCKNNFVYCQMCVSMVNVNELLCCDKCLFPIIDDALKMGQQTTANQQLYVFAMLSVCYWNEMCNRICTLTATTTTTTTALIKNDTAACTDKLIWKHRLRMAWETAHVPFVCFFAKTLVCVQCGMDNVHVLKHYDCNEKLKHFNINYFCYKCLFPLFDTLIFV
ncbi:ORF-88 [Catopsilia pomona nucleopolyhedrovirus]|uniref:ORF-88 n=1 Tax=Catopsilia pomona nucleopolyhedrovirus TaxID=1850906 RepID=A0A172WZG0_9ABAC|nr:ORF-88 [Catopsilia pomona nucleopolyhedrovirus]ANF29736.1 ORF-88 [Catopsilia pomona nucleopolyhedrovirus]